jgi:hypothetical protein
MTQLLKSMSFHLITGFGKSASSFSHNEDNITGQGVLQGSSSAAPLYLLNSDISLQTYRRLGKGAAFYHPITHEMVYNHGVQYVDDTSQFLNPLGAAISPDITSPLEIGQSLGQIATSNSKLWAECMWMSGGLLNDAKCFYYAFLPTWDYKTNTIKYSPLPLPSPVKLFNPATNNSLPMSNSHHSSAKQTLGVIISPHGNGTSQIRHSIQKSREYFGKL